MINNIYIHTLCVSFVQINVWEDLCWNISRQILKSNLLELFWKDKRAFPHNLRQYMLSHSNETYVTSCNGIRKRKAWLKIWWTQQMC